MLYLQNEPRKNYQSKFVLKLSASRIDTKMKSFAPFTDCFINNALIKFIPGRAGLPPRQPRQPGAVPGILGGGGMATMARMDTNLYGLYMVGGWFSTPRHSDTV